MGWLIGAATRGQSGDRPDVAARMAEAYEAAERGDYPRRSRSGDRSPRRVSRGPRTMSGLVSPKDLASIATRRWRCVG